MTAQALPEELGYASLRDLMALMTGDEKHDEAATSTIDIVWVLYDQVLRVTPVTADSPDRDRFLLSKGHGPTAYYVVLAAKGFVPLSALSTFGQFNSPLGHHPDRLLVPGVEVSSGSLGHGLGLAVGTALGLRLQGRDEPRVVVLLGDAELDEGTNHEAIVVAARLGLGSLTAVVVDNASASLGWPGGIEHRFTTEGWAARVVDGRSHADLANALSWRSSGPNVVVAQVEPEED